ncbi:MAG TPA: DNA gyrase modulator, partial [Chloroflexota bacterium]|nr:DNA gyrase modulator [Chloroflexota bacterium]
MTAETLIGRDDFRRLANLALKSSEADHTFVSLHDVSSGTTRFANNQIVQNLNQHRVTLSVTVAFGRRHGTATATDFGEESIRDMVKRAAAAARVSPEDPEYVPPLGPQQYASLPTTNEATVQAGPERRIALAGDAIAFCRREGVTAAGIVASGVAAVGVAANTGLFAYEQRTDAKFSLTAIAGEASGWSANVHRSIERLDVTNRTEIAIRKAQQGKSPKELPP